MVFQVVELEIFDDNNRKNNVKGKGQLSDGTSKITAMITDNLYNKLIEKGIEIDQYCIFCLNVGKQIIKIVKDTP